MNREMNKKDRKVSHDVAKEMLSSAREGSLAMHGDDGYPYCIPVNYVYYNDAIYFHGANYGYKIDALKANPKVCFSAIINSEIAPELFTTKFESIVATGDVTFVEDETERQAVMEAFIDVFSADFKEGGLKFIKAAMGKTTVMKMHIHELTGKAFRSDKW